MNRWRLAVLACALTATPLFAEEVGLAPPAQARRFERIELEVTTPWAGGSTTRRVVIDARGEVGGDRSGRATAAERRELEAALAAARFDQLESVAVGDAVPRLALTVATRKRTRSVTLALATESPEVKRLREAILAVDDRLLRERRRPPEAGPGVGLALDEELRDPPTAGLATAISGSAALSGLPRVHPPMALGDGDLEVLARIVKGETWPGSTFEAHVAIAAVVLNRVRSKSFPKTVAEVAHQPKQFSCYNPSQRGRLYEGEIPAIALRAARAAAAGADPVSGATHYYNPTLVKPGWADDLVPLKTIGTKPEDLHVFYREDRRKKRPPATTGDATPREDRASP